MITSAQKRAIAKYHSNNKDVLYKCKCIYRLNKRIERFFNEWSYKF